MPTESYEITAKAKINLLDTTENRGFELIRDMKTCLFFTTRPLKDNEVAFLKTKNQLPESFPIGYDALSFIVNPNNPDTCITVNDIKWLVKRLNSIL